MGIPSQCEHCNHQFDASEKYSGMRVKCPACKQTITVDAVEMELEPAGPPPVTQTTMVRERDPITASRAVSEKMQTMPLAQRIGLYGAVVFGFALLLGMIWLYKWVNGTLPD